MNGIKMLDAKCRQQAEELARAKQASEAREKYIQEALDGRLRDNVGELANYRHENEELRAQVEALRQENQALKVLDHLFAMNLQPQVKIVIIFFNCGRP